MRRLACWLMIAGMLGTAARGEGDDPPGATSKDFPADLATWPETDPPKRGSRLWGEAAQDYQHEWVVAVRNGRARARLRGNEKDDAPDPLPFEIKKGPAEEGLAGRRLSIKVPDGWIVGFDAGEFGGGLWWFSPDGQKSYKIAEGHVRGLISTQAGPVVLDGLAHLRSSEGRVLRLDQAPGGRWRSEDLVDLKHAPEAYALNADGSLTVATTDRLLRFIPATGKVEVLVGGAFWGGLYPNSMAITPAGVIYVGMRHGVAKIEKKNDKWAVRWLLPKKDATPKKAKKKSVTPGL